MFRKEKLKDLPKNVIIPEANGVLLCIYNLIAYEKSTAEVGIYTTEILPVINNKVQLTGYDSYIGLKIFNASYAYLKGKNFAIPFTQTSEGVFQLKDITDKNPLYRMAFVNDIDLHIETDGNNAEVIGMMINRHLFNKYCKTEEISINFPTLKYCLVMKLTGGHIFIPSKL